MKKYILWIFVLLLIISGIFLISKGLTIQNIPPKNITLLKNSLLHYNKIVNKDSGLYKDGNTYIFKGNNVSNYINIFNRLYRITSFDDKQVKLISYKNEGVFFYGSSDNYLNSNIYLWLNKGENEHSGVYSDSIENFDYLEKNELDSYFSILDLDTYNKAGREDSYLNNGESSFLLDHNKVIVKEESGSIKEEVSATTSSGIRVLLNLKNGITITKGKGTKKDPFLVENDTYINKYVKLGNDIYQVFFSKDDLLKLRRVETLDKKYRFSNNYSGFRQLNKNNIAYYLNDTYYNKLSYKKYLKTCEFYTGELMDDYNYMNIYNSKVNAKVGLLNIFDLNESNFLNDYYFINTSKMENTISYSYDRFGHITLSESNVVKKILPVVCISFFDIVDGEGSMEKPFILEK